MASKVRNTEIATLIESFLDANEENLPPVMFDELEDLAEEIDRLADEKETEIADLNARVEELEQEIEELTNG